MNEQIPVMENESNPAADRNGQAPDQNMDRQKRLRLWGIKDCFKCPVVDMCLTEIEQRQLLKKTKVAVKRVNPFELHELLVSSSDSENHASRRVDALLHRKFGKQTTELITLDSQAFRAYFKSAFASGDHAMALWGPPFAPICPPTLRGLFLETST
jgi:hypothetical protein